MCVTASSNAYASDSSLSGEVILDSEPQVTFLYMGPPSISRLFKYKLSVTFASIRTGRSLSFTSKGCTSSDPYFDFSSLTQQLNLSISKSAHHVSHSSLWLHSNNPGMYRGEYHIWILPGSGRQHLFRCALWSLLCCPACPRVENKIVDLYGSDVSRRLYGGPG